MCSSLSPYSGASIATSPAHQAALRRGLHELVPVEDLLGDGLGAVQSGNRREEIVRADVLALDHPSAAEDITILGGSGAIEAATQPVQLLQNDNIPAWNFSIPDEEGGCRQRCDPSSDQIDFRIVLPASLIVIHWKSSRLCTPKVQMLRLRTCACAACLTFGGHENLGESTASSHCTHRTIGNCWVNSPGDAATKTTFDLCVRAPL